MKKLEKALKYSKKGITLIALVITIIVLLILAGVSIATLTGENGILTRANEASKKQNQATAKEKVEVEVLGSYTENGNFDLNLFRQNIIKNLGIKESDIQQDEIQKAISIELDGVAVNIYKDGTVKLKEEDINEQLQIGNYIEYSPNTEISSVSLKDYNGTATENIIREELKWRYFGNDNSGNAILISNRPTTSTINIHGAAGYNNAVKIFNEVCNKLYSNSNIAKESRNINIEDVKDCLTNEILINNVLGFIGTNGTKYGEMSEYTNYTKYPSLYLQEQNGLDLSEEGLKCNGYIENSEKLTVKQTYWYLKNVKEENLKSTNYYELLFEAENGFYPVYWISSRCVSCDYVAYFCINIIKEGTIKGEIIFNSANATNYSADYTLRPIIVLQPDIEIVGGNGTLEEPYIIEK